MNSLGFRRIGMLGALAALLLVGKAQAYNGPFGAGVVVGEPTGLTGKYFWSKEIAFDGGVAWSLSGDNELHLYGDYLFHFYEPFKNYVSGGELPLYVGIGGRVKFREHKDDKAGVRIPVGVDYRMSAAPFGIFAEVVPIVDVAPDTKFDINGGVGIRVYF